METKFYNTPRKFDVGLDQQVTISDHGKIQLEDNEMLSFITDSGKEYDVVRKNWGFYATPSMNARLKNEGFKTALVRNSKGQWYVMIVDEAKITEFKEYIASDKNELIEWLDEKE